MKIFYIKVKILTSNTLFIYRRRDAACRADLLGAAAAAALLGAAAAALLLGAAAAALLLGAFRFPFDLYPFGPPVQFV